MRAIKLRVWFFDGEDESAGSYISLGTALSEDIVYFEGRELSASDECAIIEQFTGLHDSDGREIYQGDIARILYSGWPSKTDGDTRTLKEYLYDIASIGTIEWDLGDACFYVSMQPIKHGHVGGGIDPGRHGFIRVIGNIHENPELLDATR